jgi:hypothetical protein
MKKTHLMTKLMAAGRGATWATSFLLGSLALSSQAATATFDFNTDPTNSGQLTVYGDSIWVPSGGVGASTNANDGYLQVTAAANGQRGAIVFSDFDGGQVVAAFTFDMDVRIGNGTQPPADGFSINYVRANDPVLAAANPATGDNVWATGPNCEANLPEEGSQTGIGIGFDAWNSGGTAPFCNEADQSIGPDIIGVSVRVDGILVTQFATPTLNGACNDPTSLQTGPRDGTGDPSILCWAHVRVVLDTNGVLNVFWKGVNILNNYQTTYFPSAGRLAFAGRTGNSNENHDVDNITITTIPASIALVGGITAYADGFAVGLSDSGSSVINTNSITTTLNGSPVTPVVTKTGPNTTATYHGFPTLLTPGTTNIVVVHASDTNNNAINGTRTFVVPNYSVVPGNLAVNGVNTTAPGFRMLPYQAAGEPNRLYWAMEQIAGLHGANNADLTLATDGGYMDYTTNEINFNITPASAPGGGDAGNFTTNNGYSDALFPGIPGLNGLNGSTAENIVGFIRFANAGLYTMGVNSDDGFVVSIGHNPSDRFAQVLGQFDGGRGSSDTTFTFAVTNAGIYPIRLLWENGNGEAGNGANLEWFTVTTNGTKVLVNDPSVTNTTGVTVFYSGPALPAWVSHVNPYNGAANVRADTLIFQLTDGSTTVNGGSISLKVNGSPVTTTVSKVGNVTTVRGADVTHLLPAGTNVATLVWTDSAATTTTNSLAYTVQAFVTLDASISAPLSAADITQPGFVLKVAQVDTCLAGVLGGATDCPDGTVNQVDSANAMIAGLYYPWYGTNAADPTTVPADEVNGNSYTWNWTHAIDFNIVTSAGDFGFDYTLPGIPSIDGVSGNNHNESFSASFDCYVPFTNAGYYVLGVDSDDGFRVSQGWGVSREILHVKGASVERDVLAVPSTPASVGGTVWRGTLPIVPITAPIVYVDSSECPGPTTLNLSGKIALIDADRCGSGDNAGGNYNKLAAMCQARGAIAVLIEASPGWGTPELMTGGTNVITIPALHLNGFNGEKDWFHTNGPLVATIGGDTHIKLGEADFGKGMDHRDFGFIVPAPGLYPMHLIYEQGGGGAGLEWTVVGPDIPFDSANRAMMNDNTSSSSLLTYRAITPAPKFTSATSINGALSMTWFGGGVLQQTTSLVAPVTWTDVNPQPPGDAYLVSSSGTKYYRLRR